MMGYKGVGSCVIFEIAVTWHALVQVHRDFRRSFCLGCLVVMVEWQGMV